MIEIKPYITIPNLIAQPTWGGKYIVIHKQLKPNRVEDPLIGQSYELYKQTHLSKKYSTLDYPSIESGLSDDPEVTIPNNQLDQPLPIQQLIDVSPEKILGRVGSRRLGGHMDLLIKYTQAKDNSFQVHPRENTGSWENKPESWYYLEPGTITLGTKPGIDFTKYQQVCQFISQKVESYSHQVLTQKISRDQALLKIKAVIDDNDPFQFVNLLTVDKESAIDLSAGGIHHSWENNPNQPLGNVLYEIQKNAYDPVSTLRAFDKGKLKPDGSCRQLRIEEYFQFINRDETANNPQQYFSKKQILENTDNYQIQSIFHTSLYSLRQLTIKQLQSVITQKTTTSFHHLFAQSGGFRLIIDADSRRPYEISRGFGIFIPADIGQYSIQSTSNESVVLQTLVE